MRACSLQVPRPGGFDMPRGLLASILLAAVSAAGASAAHVRAATPPPAGQIVYSEGGNLLLMDADGRHQRYLTDHDNSAYQAAWSPDGSRIAFASARLGDYDIYTIAADGSGLLQVTRDPG